MTDQETDTEQPTLLDETLPDPDFTLIEHIVLPVTADVAYAAVGSLDLTDVRDPVTRAALWVRGLPERLGRRIPPRRPTRMTFDDLVIGTDWVLLGQRPGHEIALGAAGRFWTPVIRWIPVRPDEFAEFEKPGYGRIGMAFSVRPYGDHRSVVTYEGPHRAARSGHPTGVPAVLGHRPAIRPAGEPRHAQRDP